MSLRHRIKLIADQAPDGTVDPDYTGTPFMTGIPCLISDVRGMEKYRGRQIEATTDVVIELRYLDNVLPNMVAVNELTNVQYLIKATPADPYQRKMSLHCTEVKA